MSNQLIPPPELAPPSLRHLPFTKRIELWAALIDEGEAMLRANLRAMTGSEEEFRGVYRDWNLRRLEQKERNQIRFLENLARREAQVDK